MTGRHERSLLLHYAHRLTRAFPASSTVAAKLVDWVSETDLGIAWEAGEACNRRRGTSPRAWSDLRARLEAAASRPRESKPDTLARNTAVFAAHAGLDAEETAIFALAVRAANRGPLKTLCDHLTDDARLPPEEAVTHLLGMPAARVRKALAPSARLMTTGLLARDRPPFHGLGLDPCERLYLALERPAGSVDEILDRLFLTAPPPDVAWEDFAHLGANRDFALRLLDGALARGEPGVNLLFHGAPGTGKTALCKALAAKLGARLYAVGESDDDGDEPSRSLRLQQLRLGQRLLGGRGRGLVLFDEMEDLFPASTGLFSMMMTGRGSKVHMNRLLETNPTPTLWTTNDIAACDPAFLRRITFTLELRTPSPSIRARLWGRLAAQHGVPLPRETCAALARTIDEAPALADTALRAARIAGGGDEAVTLAVTALARAVSGARALQPSSDPLADFDPTLARADHDLDALADRLAVAGPRTAASICLDGPPGSGKSAFARHLAHRLDMPVLERRASDLLDRYVGGSERNIAAAFAEARDTGAFLVFDEADSLLGARGGALQRWEVSQVNEMLTWMESHPLPFVCTTNLPEQLDPAAARRFVLRVRFLPLDAEQRARSFRRLFGAEPPPGLEALDLLTPGDFAVVARRAALLGPLAPEALLAELAREQAAKPDARRPMGFRAA